jgi:hypothetical protein
MKVTLRIRETPLSGVNVIQYILMVNVVIFNKCKYKVKELIFKIKMNNIEKYIIVY